MNYIFNFFLFISMVFFIQSCKSDVQQDNQSAEEQYFEDYDAPFMKWGYINTNGETVIENKYDDLRPFNDGLAIANYKGKWGFINKKGEMVIEHKYRSAFPFKNGLARIQNFDKLYGFIDKTGKMVIPDTFQLVFDFDSGLARAKKNENYGYIDTLGNWTIRSNYKKCSNFNNDVAKVYQFGKAGLIDKTGKYLIPLEEGNEKIFDTDKKLIRTKKADTYYFYSTKDFSNKSQGFTDATDFYDGIAAVKKDGKWNLINSNMKELAEFEADDVKYAANDRWIVKRNGAYEIIDNDAKVITQKPYNMIFAYNNGFAPYQTGDFWGYLDIEGYEAMSPVLPLAWEFEENYARIIMDGRITYIDTSMKVQIPKGYLDAHNFSEGLAHVQ